MPPRKQSPQQNLKKEDDVIVIGNQFKEMMHMIESLTASMNVTFDKTTTSTNEMFHKSQASTETTIERMQCGITFSIPLIMPPKKQPPQQNLKKEDDVIVIGKQFKEMMHMIESLTASMNETFDKTTTSTNEMFHKSQAPTETTIERMQYGITTMADRVQALETRLPIATTDPNPTAPNTHVDGEFYQSTFGLRFWKAKYDSESKSGKAKTCCL
jgi:hypothetical protein